MFYPPTITHRDVVKQDKLDTLLLLGFRGILSRLRTTIIGNGDVSPEKVRIKVGNLASKTED
jgi:hypothetical protein